MDAIWQKLLWFWHLVFWLLCFWCQPFVLFKHLFNLWERAFNSKFYKEDTEVTATWRMDDLLFTVSLISEVRCIKTYSIAFLYVKHVFCGDYVVCSVLFVCLSEAHVSLGLSLSLIFTLGWFLPIKAEKNLWKLAEGSNSWARICYCVTARFSRCFFK